MVNILNLKEALYRSFFSDSCSSVDDSNAVLLDEIYYKSHLISSVYLLFFDSCFFRDYSVKVIENLQVSFLQKRFSFISVCWNQGKRIWCKSIMFVRISIYEKLRSEDWGNSS